jgi:hypothetical protein
MLDIASEFPAKLRDHPRAHLTARIMVSLSALGTFFAGSLLLRCRKQNALLLFRQKLA